MGICLHSICMKKDAVFLCNLTQFTDRLQSTDLIVCIHHRNQDRIRTDCIFQYSRLHKALPVYRKVCQIKTAVFQEMTCMKDGMMFYGRGDDMTSFSAERPGSIYQHPVI